MNRGNFINFLKIAIASAVIWELYRLYNQWRVNSSIDNSIMNDSIMDNSITNDMSSGINNSTKNIQAFLKTIRYSEGTLSSDGYSLLYGGGHFYDYSNHPYLTGEWKGMILPPQQCIKAGFSAGCKSTAAGAYQITASTWKGLQATVAGLNDFMPDEQDKGAIALIMQKGALGDVKNGNIQQALRKVSGIWASLPGNTAGQPQKSIAEIEDYFTTSGGVLA